MTRALALALLLATAAPARAEDEGYELRTGGAVEVTTGAKGAGSLTIVPAAGYRIHVSAPVSVRLSVEPPPGGSEGLVLGKKRLHRGDAADARADALRFDVPFVASTAGSYTIAASVRFWLCGAHSCRPVRARAEIPVTAAAPAE